MPERQPPTETADPFTQALAHQSAGRGALARASYETALASNPNNTGALNNLGVLLNSMGLHAEALQRFDQQAALTPSDARAHANRGVALKALGQLAEAATAYRQALACDRSFHTAHNNLGNLHYGQGAFAQALVEFEAACQLQPASSEYRFMLAKCLLEVQQMERAEAELRLVLRTHPEDADAWGTLARLWTERHSLPEALACFERGLAARPDYAGLQYNRGLARLLAGDLPGGFADYERRFDVPDFPSKRLKTTKPVWNGEPIADKTLLVHAEQGLGDTLQFLRYIALLSPRCLRVLLLIQESITSLVVLPSNVELVHEGTRPPAYDLVCPLLSLPHLLGLTVLQDIPARVPYLHCMPARSTAWQERFASSDTTSAGTTPALRVGLVWAGNPSHKNDANRSMDLATLAPLLAVEGVQFYSLQVGARSADLASLQPDVRVRVSDLSADLHDFGDTAAAIQQLDVLVCVDTSICHVAGAMGLPVWLLLPWMPDWRWLLHREDSPWYPSLRILRQPRYQDWGSVVATLAKDIRELATPHSAAGRRRQALAHDWVEQGRVLLERNEPALATPAFWRALRECPTHARAASALAIAAYRTGDTHAAVMLGQRACRLAPLDPENWSNCGAYLKNTGDLHNALAFQQTAVRLQPRSAQAQANLGNTLGALGQWEDALPAAQLAVSLSPKTPEFHYNLGIAQKECALFEDALASFKLAQSVTGGHVKSALHQALLELLTGDLDAGWRHYESRWIQPDAKERRNFAQPLWTGQDLTDKTILVHAEQGFGDSFQFVRYVPLLAQRGARVVMVVQPDVQSLLGRIVGVAEVVTSGSNLPAFDYQCPMLSLPGGFETTLQSIPATVPYLAAEPSRIAHWQEQLGARKRYRVAVVWAGRPTHGNDANRSIRLADLEPLMQLEGVEFISVQKGDAVAQLSQLPKTVRLINLSPHINSFEDTAAILTQVDELVTVDTSVAHLAGAMGVKVRVLLPLIPDWRWLTSRADSPWYPTASLHRQTRRGDWSKPVKHLVKSVARDATQWKKPAKPRN